MQFFLVSKLYYIIMLSFSTMQTKIFIKFLGADKECCQWKTLILLCMFKSLCISQEKHHFKGYSTGMKMRSIVWYLTFVPLSQHVWNWKKKKKWDILGARLVTKYEKLVASEKGQLYWGASGCNVELVT